MNAVTRVFPLRDLALPDEFFPAHLSVALIDAVFRVGLSFEEDHEERSAERYCLRFGISRVRGDRWELPPPDVQESLCDLVGHYEALGTQGMMDEVFRSRRTSPGSNAERVEHVLGAATALRRIGVEVLQDVSDHPREEIERALRCPVGIDDSTIRTFLMYSGEDDFVRGDFHVCRFVGNAIGRRSVPPDEAEALVRQAAHELILAPRYLDREIWVLGASLLDSTR